MSSAFHKLTVADVRRETDQAVSLVFQVPPELKETFAWRAGQHITVRLQLGGEEARRSYSISTCPHDGSPLRITVKRVSGGLVSSHINDTVKPGDEIEASAPFGRFCLDADPLGRRTHYFFAAGSGITPIYAMILAVLNAEPYSVAHLAYGNRNEDTMIFRDRLGHLTAAHPERFTVAHLFSAPSIWSSFSYWRNGKLDADAVAHFISDHPPYAQEAQYYICGPGPMNGQVKAALMSIDVPAARIHMESFGGSETDDSVKGIPATARVRLNGQQTELNIDAGQTLLDALRAAGLEPPYSCQAGVCSACRAKLTAGSVHMRARVALEDHEIEAGEILTCQSVATSAHLQVSFAD
ncbi:MAG: ferredoxin--NADP reductase [Pseudomonadota bacterium]